MSIRKGSSIISGNGGAGGGSAMNVDDVTTSLNQSNEIQAIGVIEKNNSEVKYDWIGTYAEWVEGRNNSTIDDTWICYITDDNKTIPLSKERTLGETIFSLIPLTDSSLHLLDGALIDGTGVYNQFYAYMKRIYDNGTTECFTTESDWQTSVTTYGVCGKFVLDTTNQTIRLPKVTGFVEGTLDEAAIGELVEAGLPDITGRFYGVRDNSVSGAFAKVGGAKDIDAGTTYWANNVEFKASRSNAIYGKSDTVQPQTIKGFYYIVLATTVNLDISLDIDEVVSDVEELQTEIGGADYVVEWQAPTSANNYTWYRLYKSGWVEQGGRHYGFDSLSTSAETTITMIKEMDNTNYNCQAHGRCDNYSAAITVSDRTASRTTTQFVAGCRNQGSNPALNVYIEWQVSGMVAQS